MPRKRKHHDMEPEKGVHASRRMQVFGDKPKPSKKPRRSESTLKEQTATVNGIKKQIRDIRRRLDRVDNLPANIRADDERALAAYEQELAEAQATKHYQRNLQRFHMVRFFERQKATRTAKKLRKQLLEATSEDQVNTLKSLIHVAEVDLNYTQFCPLGEPYISLYPRKPQTEEDVEDGDGDEDAKMELGLPSKPPMWEEVEKRMAEGSLDELRNRVVTNPPPVARPMTKQVVPERPKSRPVATPTPAAPNIDTTGMNRRERRKHLRIKEPKVKIKSKSAGFEKNQAFGAAEAAGSYRPDNADDDGSDGGFFED